MKNNKIPGWYDWDEWNKNIVATLPDGALYFEVGCFLGRSTAALAQHIQDSGKKIRLQVVDTFALKPGDPEALYFALNDQGKTVKGLVKFREVFERNMREAGFIVGRSPDNWLQAYTAPSTKHADSLRDEVADVVFIDAEHGYDAVLADIRAWWPKLKRGGVMAGHDIYTYDTVYRAVKVAVEELKVPLNIIAEQNIWELKKP